VLITTGTEWECKADNICHFNSFPQYPQEKTRKTDFPPVDIFLEKEDGGHKKQGLWKTSTLSTLSTKSGEKRSAFIFAVLTIERGRLGCYYVKAR
jgi:hypothetical protein